MTDTILSLLRSDGCIIVNKTLIQKLGLEGAVMFSELCSKYDYWKNRNGLTKDGYFYCTAECMEDSTGFTNYQQKKIIKILITTKLIAYKITSLPPKAHYKIIATEKVLKELLKNNIKEI